MNNKNHTLVVVLLTIIATTLVLGSIYLLLNQKTPRTESPITNEQEIEKESPITQPLTVSKETEKEVQSVFESA
jgi:hypothetical protein